MLEQFFATMRIAWIAGRISARHTLERPYALAYHHPLEQSLFNVLNTEKSGVFVHWGVYESGKSTAARQAAWRLQEEAGKQVILLQSYKIQWNWQGENWLRRAIRVPEYIEDKPMTDFFTQDTTITIDHFDMFMRDKHDSAVQTLEMVCGLIKEKETTQKFNVTVLALLVCHHTPAGLQPVLATRWTPPSGLYQGATATGRALSAAATPSATWPCKAPASPAWRACRLYSANQWRSKVYVVKRDCNLQSSSSAMQDGLSVSSLVENPPVVTTQVSEESLQFISSSIPEQRLSCTDNLLVTSIINRTASPHQSHCRLPAQSISPVRHHRGHHPHVH
jgi:hypothetical protein